MRIILPKNAILIGTQPDRKEQLDNCIASLDGVSYPVIISDCEGYEVGKFKELLKLTDVENFVFLQDSIEVKDQSIFDLCFSSQASVSLNEYPQSFGCYIGKFKRSVLEKMSLPHLETKLDIVNYEVKIDFYYKRFTKVEHI